MRRRLLVTATAALVLATAAAALWRLQPAAPSSATVAQWGVLAAVHDPESMRALRQAARDGSVAARRVLGSVLVDQADSASVREGRDWLEQAARAADAKAQLDLGRLLFKGAPGVAADYSAARPHLQAAVEGGEMGSAYYLGLIYKNGAPGIAANAQTAAHWLEVAASAEVADAQFLLGQMLLVGDGVAPDPMKARAWFEKAAEHEHPEANLQLLMARTRGEMSFDKDVVATEHQYMEAQHSLRHRPPAP